MSDALQSYLLESADVVKQAAETLPPDRMADAVRMCVAALQTGKSILVCGNGGSASDAMHIAGELVARFMKERKGQSCICLADNPAMLTAWSNDYDFESVFARQVEAFGSEGCVLLGLSTSGNSKNVIKAAEKAREIGIKTIMLTGEGGGKLAALSDVLLDVPSKKTPLIQQVHICYYHYLCEKVEEAIAA